jgi:cell pole-organizing protein PopZ
MEEILASIRRIIAEDDGVRPAPVPAKPTVVPTSVHAPAQFSTPTLAADVRADVEEMLSGFDDPQLPGVAANDMFELGESVPSKPPEFPGDDPASDEMFDDAQDAPEDSAEPAKAEPAKPEPAGPETARAEPAWPEAVRLEPVRAEPARSESARSESVRSEPTRRETTRPDPFRPEPARPEPAGPEPARPERPAAPAAARAVPQATGEAALLSPRTTAAVDMAFNTLAHTVLVQNSRTLDELVREMLKPMLKAWLDDNLPNMVERLVRAEIERVSRGRG